MKHFLSVILTAVFIAGGLSAVERGNFPLKLKQCPVKTKHQAVCDKDVSGKIDFNNCVKNIKLYEKCPYKEERNCKKWKKKQKNKICKSKRKLSSYIKEHFSKWDKKLNSLQLDFKQTTNYTDVDLCQNITGKLYFHKLKGLRFEYILPRPQIIWRNKKDIYIYQPETKNTTAQAIKSKWSDWVEHNGANYLGIIDFGHYSQTLKKHTITGVEFAKNLVSIKMHPKKNKNLYSLTLCLNKKDLFPSMIKFKLDNMVSDIQIIETGIKINKKIKDEIFKVNIPKKVEITSL